MLLQPRLQDKFIVEKGVDFIASHQSCELITKNEIPVISNGSHFELVPMEFIFDLFYQAKYADICLVVEQICENINERKNKSLH